MTTSAPTLGVVTTDRHLVVRGWNEWVAAATGVPEAGVVGRPLLELVTGERTEFYRDLFAEVLESGTPRVLAPAFHHYLIACAPRLPSAHFSHMQQRVTVAPLRADADVVGVMITLEDVTERLDSERALASRLEQPESVAVSEVTTALASEDWRLRGHAVRLLRQSASVDEIKHLFDSLQREHHDLNLLNSALRVLIASGRAVVEPLVELLSDETPNLRMHAALALGELRAVPAVPGLVRALEDPDENVRFHAIEALGRIGAPESIEALAAIAADGEFFLGFAAVEALSKAADDARVAPLMIQLLDHELLRPAVIGTLAAIGDEDSAAPLALILNEPGADPGPIASALVRIHARYESSFGAGSYVVDAVRDVLGPGAVGTLAAAAERAGPDRVALAAVLGWIGAPAAPTLVTLLPEAELVETVMAALVAIGKEATPAVLSQLTQGHPGARAAAATVLGRLGDRRATPSLVAALDDADAEVVAASAGALAGLADESAVDGLVAVFAHPHAAARRAAIAAVNTIGAAGTAAKLQAVFADPLPRVRECAVRTAGYFGFPECAAAIVHALADPAEDVRRAAIEQLPMIDGIDAASRLLAAVTSETPRNRAAAAHALRHSDDPRAGTALGTALQDADLWVRYYAAASLGEGRFGAATAPRLAELARQDAAVPVRIAAVTALAQLDPALAASAAADLLGDPEDDVATAAVTALAGIPGRKADQLLEQAARSPRAAVQLAVVRALGQRTQPEAVELLSWAARSVEVSSQSGEAIDSLRKIAASPDNALARRAAVDTLLDLAGEPARREDVIAALGRLPEDAVTAVASGLSASRPDHRIAAAEALAVMRHPRASSELSRALSDEDASVRAAAVTAFGRLGTPSVSRVIAAMRHTDADEGVRYRAAQACARHGWGARPLPLS